jgi:diaminopimelate decarboxylase
MDWTLLSLLAARYGQSFYVLHVERFADNFREFRDAFRRYYPATQVAYSYKTNYLPWICRFVDAEGGYAEVVSPMEYELASLAGVRPSRIILNGPFKSAQNLARALHDGALVNLDSPYELELLREASSQLGDAIGRVGVRCNFQLDECTISRFGFDSGGDLTNAVSAIRSLPNCRLVALHCHYSTRSRDVASFRRRTSMMIELSRRLFPDSAPQMIDVGGGFFSKMDTDLRAQFGGEVPDYAEYAAAVAPLVAEAFAREPRPELVVEPGTALAADAMSFVTRVVDVKTVRGRRIALVDGSIYNTRPTLHQIRLPLRAVSAEPSAEDDAHTDVVGHTCMENDCLATYHGPLRPGDFLVFGNVGAYTLVLKPAFIHPCAPVIAYDDRNGQHFLAKRQEQPADVFATYQFDTPP